MSSAAAAPSTAAMHNGRASASAFDCMDGGIEPGADFFEGSSSSSEGEEEEGEDRRRTKGEKEQKKDTHSGMEDADEDAWEFSSSASSISVHGTGKANSGLGINLDAKERKTVTGNGLLLMKWRSGESGEGQVLHRVGESSTADVDMDAEEDEEEDGLSEEEERKGRPSTRRPPTEAPANSKDNNSNDKGNGKPRQARQMSLRRLAPGSREGVRLVHNHGSHSRSGSASVSRTPRDSLVSAGDAADQQCGQGHHRNYSFPTSIPSLSAVSLRGSAESSTLEKLPAAQTRHRSDTNDSLNAVLQTHAMTMRALESWSPTASYAPVPDSPERTKCARATLGFSGDQVLSPLTRGGSLSASRHIHIPPILPTRPRHHPHSRRAASDEPTRYNYDVRDNEEYSDVEEGYSDRDDANRPPHLPPHFVRTPYPLTPKKEFPRPNTRPRRHSLHDASEGEEGRLVRHARPAGDHHVRTGTDEENYSDQQLKGSLVVGLVPSTSDKWSVKGKQVLGLELGDDEGRYVRSGGAGGRWPVRRTQSEKVRRGGNGRIGGGVGREGGVNSGGKPLFPIPHSGTAGGSDGVMGATHGVIGIKELGVVRNDDTSKHVVYISLRHRGCEDGISKRLERLEIPRNLTATTATHYPWRGEGTKGAEKNPRGASKLVSKTTTCDFDDAFFAEHLHLAYRHLAGSWFRRALSARKLSYIQLARVDIWNCGASPSAACTPERNSRTSTASSTGLLMAVQVRSGGTSGVGNDDEANSFDIDASNPFTEEKLWDLWRHPQDGKGRYTWVHWARRIAAMNPGLLGVESEKDLSSSSPPTGTSTLTVQLTHAFSILRLLVALSVMIALTVAAAVLWIFLGTSGWRGLQAGGRGRE
ncbi:uncharacterized protein EI97DRAFT_459763 [Westerdykella ornata]|uniref:Uncharacterized protein n=1 Tax=Westerdykella ornata TaxID=318751 RepID=A0A6A6JEE7_WESOR|nr:uncharacterized protein EI97DRAFT_459763 [Westerdykella ornata]KAF2274792.1 hypothetical protein EI97DRAFT_459763 [Westerdykella ornata]